MDGKERMPVKKLFALLCVFTLVLLACSVTIDLGTLPAASTPTSTLSGRDLVASLVAQTFQASTQTALAAAPSNTPAPSATPTITPTPLPAYLSVSVTTNCYGGPSTHYGLVYTLHTGTVVTVVGRDTSDNYWIISVPNYPGTTCWLPGQYTSLTGDTTGLVEVATPYVPYPYTLNEPTRLRISCSVSPSSYPGPHVSIWRVVFSWRNNDPDQTGVRIYRNGWRIATLSGNATSFTDVFTHYHWHHDVTYGVQAFNGYEVSAIETIDVDHC